MKHIILFLGITAAIVTPALAENAPKCSQSSAGQVTCMATKLCECKHFNASLMQDTPEGYRWDCGIMRPTCQEPKKADETKSYDGPSSVNLGDKHNIEVNN